MRFKEIHDIEEFDITDDSKYLKHYGIFFKEFIDSVSDNLEIYKKSKNKFKVEIEFSTDNFNKKATFENDAVTSEDVFRADKCVGIDDIYSFLFTSMKTCFDMKKRDCIEAYAFITITFTNESKGKTYMRQKCNPVLTYVHHKLIEEKDINFKDYTKVVHFFIGNWGRRMHFCKNTHIRLEHEGTDI